MNTNLAFPIEINEIWQEALSTDIPDPALKNWLLHTGSLTERLQAHCRKFEVQVIGQQEAPLSQDEYHQVFEGAGSELHKAEVREVVLCCDEQPWVFARSVLPSQFLTEGMRELKTLGNQPLGKIIFNDPQFERQAFQLVQCSPESELVNKLGVDSQFVLWGRRSVFKFNEFRIMVAEVFLPASPAYKNFVV